jgi:exopolysaccharide production protein ExoZ
VSVGPTVAKPRHKRQAAQMRWRRASVEQDPSGKKTPRYAWLDLLRAMAVLFVVWDHFVGEYLGRTGQTWPPDRFVNAAFFQPLHITQFGGFFGVCVFFLISGYIITRVSTNETASQFAIRRVLRIFPPLIAAVALVIAFGKMGLAPFALGAGATWIDALTNVTLVNYLLTSQVILVGVGWTLVIEVIFYGESLLLNPLIHRRRLIRYFPLCVTALSLIFILSSRHWTADYFLFTVSSMYVPILAIGSSFFLIEKRIINTWMFLGILVAGFAVFLYGTHNFYPQFMGAANSYPISVFLAILVFASAWLARGVIPTFRVVRAVALSSYSIYLFHSVVGLQLVEYFDGSLGYTLSLVIGLSATAAAVGVSYFMIERPSQSLARRLTTRKKAVEKETPRN